MFKILLLLAVTSCFKLGLKQSVKSGKPPVQIVKTNALSTVKIWASHLSSGGCADKKYNKIYFS